MADTPVNAVDMLVVSHTHWDREWYHSAPRFRQRLVALIDDLLARADAAPFLLDGQTIVVDDYLAVRPEMTAELAARVRDGSFTVGPWLVLADELIPSAEGLVRNLLAARRTLRALRAAPPDVLWCPDSFGHPAALPTLAAGFGCDIVVLWRGYGGGRWPEGDTVRWRAPDGAMVVLHHLPPSGYEFGASLPVDDTAARQRWGAIQRVLLPRAVTGVVLLPNGADHHAMQPEVDEAVASLARAAAPHRVRRATLSEFGDMLRRRVATMPLPEVSGELRDSYGYTWTLGGTLGTRAHLKRDYARVERLLTRDVEPWAALARYLGLGDRRALTWAAWRPLLECQPHDTLCGCSTDGVARANRHRLLDSADQAAGVREAAAHALLRHEPAVARDRRSEWNPVCVIRNPAPRSRGGIAEIEIERFIRDVPVGPGSAAKQRAPMRPERRAGIAGTTVQPLAVFRRHSRTESPLHYPDNDLVEVTRAVAWLDPLPAYGLRALPLGDPAPVAIPRPVRIRGRTVDNGLIGLTIRRDGRLILRDHRSGRVIHRLIRFEDAVDVGDLYTPSIRGTASDDVRVRRIRVVHRGPLRATVAMRLTLTGAHRAGFEAPRIPLRVELTIDAGAPFVRVRVSGRNTGRWHRTRIVFGTDVLDGEVLADAAFGPVERHPIEVTAEDRRKEAPVPTAPLHRWVSLLAADRGTTLISDGLAEYEALAHGEIAVTLLRAVGSLSRATLPERPGHAGWPVATPRAQCIGPFAAEFALAMHGADSAQTRDEIERIADDVLLPMAGFTLRSALAAPPRVEGFALEGRGLSGVAIKESDDGQWIVLRCVNVTESPVEGRWVLPVPPREARLARLDESAGEAIAIGGTSIPISAAPRGVTTILVR